MPELPEVETIRLSLQKNLVGKVIENVNIIVPKQFVGEKKDIVGKKIVAAQRKGKVISLKLSNDFYISVHLKLTGQLLFAKDKHHAVFDHQIPFAYTNTMPAKTTSIIIEFTDGSALYFNDLRKFGWVKVTTQPEGPKSVDVLSPEFTLKYLNSLIPQTKRPIKVLLMDQEKLAGIGNIYANDSLFLAGINPTRSTNSLNPDETVRLYEAILQIIQDGLKHKGSSARDEVYILPDGSKGSYQHHFKVYHRENQPCLNCKTPIKRIKQAGRSSFYCPKCQSIM